MRVKGYKALVILSLASVLVIYNNCGAPFEASSPLYFESHNALGGSPIFEGSSVDSYDSFARTVYPITRTNCISCHATQQPAHASSDVKVAHDAILANHKVNFDNISSSRMVKKLREDNHNCWGDCEENALEMENAITEWKESIKGPVDAVEEVPVDTNVYTAESKFLSEEFKNAQNGAKINVVNLNMEAAMLNPPMARITSPSDGLYLSVPNNLNTTLASNAANAGTASFNFTIRQASTQYRIWGLVNAPNTSDNGLYTNFTTTNTGIKEWEIPVTNGWEWRQLPNTTFNLPIGNHTLQIRERKDGTKIKQIVVTSDTTFSAATAPDLMATTLTFDLAYALRVPGITLKVDVLDYDAYSYKFQNPRIITSSVNIRARKVKLLVNKYYNPQHSTFTLIDKLATPLDGKLLNYAMLVIKDKGSAEDKISFSFEELKIESNMVDDPALAASQESFRTNVYPISRTNCINCHTTQNPPHAHDDYKESHDVVVTQNLVNFTTPANSRLVTKVKGRHNCGTQIQCDAVANQFEAAIIEWKKSRP